jgi:hypothetical protein
MELERRGFIKGLAALTALVAGGFVAKPAISKEIIAKGSGALPSTGKEVNEVDEVMAAASEVPGFEPDPTPALADSLDKEGLFDRPGRIIGVDGGGRSAGTWANSQPTRQTSTLPSTHRGRTSECWCSTARMVRSSSWRRPRNDRTSI